MSFNEVAILTRILKLYVDKIVRINWDEVE